jgi:hypothetical protein
MNSEPSSLCGSEKELRLAVGTWRSFTKNTATRRTLKLHDCCLCRPCRAAEWNRPAEGGKALSAEESFNELTFPDTCVRDFNFERYRKLKGFHLNLAQA